MKFSHSLILFILLLLCFNSNAQKTTVAQQEIIKKIDDIHKPSSDEDIEKIENLIEEAKKINFKEGVVKGKFKMLNVFFYRSDFKKTLELTRELDELDIKDNEQLTKLAIHKSYANKALGIQKEEIENIKDAVKYAKLIKDADKKHYQTSIAYNRFSAYYDYKNPDSLIYYLKKELEELKQLSDKNPEKLSDIALSNLNIGNYYLGVANPQRLDLAEPFYLNTYNLKNTEPEIFEKQDMPILCGVGRFYYEKGNYEKAIELLNEVIRIEKIKKNPSFRLYAYTLIGDAYGSLKNTAEQAKYTKLYANLNDSINKEAQKEVNQQFEKLVTNAEKKKDEEHSSVLTVLFLSLSAFLLILAISLWFYLKRKKYKYDELVNRIKSEKSKEEIIITEAVETEYEELVFPDNYLTENNGSLKEKPNQITDTTVNLILHKLEKFEKSNKYLRNEISLTYLASQLGTNTKYLSEVIKQHKGKNFSNYINGLRINYIATLLYNDSKFREYKTSYLAELSGFSSREVFTVVFKKETGVSPSYFIDNLKNENQLT